jgi:hypothetical protein
MDLRQICAVSDLFDLNQLISFVLMKNAECTSTQLELSMALAIVVDTATSKPGHYGSLLTLSVVFIPVRSI